MKRWMMFVLMLGLLGLSLDAQEGEILWQDNFDDDEELPLTDVGWFYYCDTTIPGNEVKQVDGQLYIKSGVYGDVAAAGLVQTNGITFMDMEDCEKPTAETIEELLMNDYSDPNQELTFQVNFKNIVSSVFIVATRAVFDPSQLSADPEQSPAYTILSNPLEGSVAIARYDSSQAVFTPENWTYFAAPKAFEFNSESTYSYRYVLNEGDIKLKVWEGDFDAEPAEWTLEGIDPDPRVSGMSTFLGLMGMMPGDEILIDNVTMRKAGTGDAVDQPRSHTPASFALYPNHPNPFNPTTEISYSMLKAGDVKVAVYNQKGQLLTTLVNGLQPAGRSSVIWNGRDAAGTMQPSGLYYARLSNNAQSKTIKMLLMK